jgi:hypothetical protein
MQTFVPLTALASDLVPLRIWLDRLAFLIPGSVATRWLLLTDIVCLVAMGRATRRPRVGIPVTLVVGFVALNLASMAVTDFYLGLALFHLTVGVAAAVSLHRARWMGMSLVALAVMLGILT